MPAKRTLVPRAKESTRTLKIPAALQAPRGVKTWKEAVDWLKVRGIEDIECITPDIASVPWETDPTAQVICDIAGSSGENVPYTPRNVLKHVLDLYKQRGWKPVVAPEIEFYLVAKNDDPDYPLHPPKGRSGRSIQGGQAYSIAGVNEFD